MARLKFYEWLTAHAAKTTLAGTEELYINDGGGSKKTTPAAIKTYLGDAAPTGASQNDGLMTHEDKAKLDGIESGATADQTAQEIATLIDADATAETTLKSALGLGSAAYTASTAYATAAQGGKADSALQPGDVDDTPVDGATTAPISSNWAFDHAANLNAHGISDFGETLVDDTSASAALTTLGAASDDLDNITLARPSIRPSLLLDFANSKVLDPRITFTRAAVGTYYDGKTVAKAEENLLKYSQEFDNGVWHKNAVNVTANSIAAPDGTTTSDTLTATSTGNALVFPTNPTVTTSSYTASVCAKAGTAPIVYFRDFLSTGSVEFTYFNVSTGAVGTASSQHTASIVSLGDDWYRCIITFTPNAARTNQFQIGIADADNSVSVTNGATAYLWGAQLEQRSSATAYTPTTSQPITNYLPVLQSAAANVARFDHDPVTGESKGLLIEEQRSNLLTYSEDFSNAGWIWQSYYDSAITSNSHIAPDATLSADTLTDNDPSKTIVKSKTCRTTADTTYTFSVYIKKTNGGAPSSYPAIATSTYFGEQGCGAIINTTTGAATKITSNLPGLNTSNITPTLTVFDAGGFWRVSMTATPSAGKDFSYWFLIPAYNTTGATTIDTTATGSAVFWGAQLEAGSFPTSYIKTEAAQVTRAADAASMTGTNFSSWYRQDEGTIYTESSVPFLRLDTNNQPNFSVGASSSYNDAIVLFTKQGTNNRAAATNIGGATKFFASLTPALANSIVKQSFSYKASASMTFVDSGIVSSPILIDTSLSLNYTRAVFGAYPDVMSPLNGYIKKVSYYPKRLTNAELVALTA